MGEESTTATEQRVWIIHPVMLAQPFLIFGMLGLALTT